MNDFFEYKDCFMPLRAIGVIPIFENSLDNCKYTIAIPTYKRPEDLVLAIESALGQDFKPFNVIVVDNNPDRGDETEIVVKERFGNYSNLSYYKNMSNVGMIKNWNRLFELSKTDYVVMLHDDDYLYPCFLTVIDRMIRIEDDISAINAGKELWNGGTIPTQIMPDDRRTSIKVYDYSPYSNYPFFHFGAPSGCVFKKDDVYQAGGFDDSVYPSSDYVFIQKMCLSGKRILRTINRMMLYRVVENTTSKIETRKQWLEIDYKIKNELSERLRIPKWINSIVKFFEIKQRVRGVCMSENGFTFRGYTRGGNVFLVFFNIYRWLYKALFINPCIRKIEILNGE